MKVTIELPDVIEFESRGEEFAFDPAKVPKDKREEFFAIAACEGISKALIDAGSSAAKYAKDNSDDKSTMTDGEATRILVDKRMATMLGGDWAAKRSSGVDAITREIISMVRKQVAAKDKAAYKDADEPTRKQMCLAYISAMGETELASYEKVAKVRIADREAQAKREAEMAKELGIKL